MPTAKHVARPATIGLVWVVAVVVAQLAVVVVVPMLVLGSCHTW